MKQTPKFIITLSLTLFLIVFLSVLSLSAVNHITADIITQNTLKAQNQARKEVVPDADTFEEILDFDKVSDIISEVYTAKANNDICGYCVGVVPNGYGGAISMMVGINYDLKVTGVTILSMNETAGLGAKAGNKEFLSQYLGKRGEIAINANNNSIKAISGATITSKAVTGGVNMAIEQVKSIAEGVR